MVTNPNVIHTSRDFINILELKNILIDAAYIFGSQAEGTAHEYSDIDLALVSKSFSGIRFDDNVLIIKNTPYTFFDIETHPYRPEDFTPDNPFVEEILKTGIRIK
jgi:predicted nucleotidyltransferase